MLEGKGEGGRGRGGGREGGSGEEKREKRTKSHSFENDIFDLIGKDRGRGRRKSFKRSRKKGKKVRREKREIVERGLGLKRKRA